MYAKRKLKAQERNRLQQALDDMSFSCGAALQDAEIPTEVADVVYVKKMMNLLSNFIMLQTTGTYPRGLGAL